LELAPSRPAFDFLEPKIQVPALRPGTVSRTSLVNRLRVTTSESAATVVAPAGYGKTTLLAQWAERDSRTFAWVTLDERDNDPIVLLRHIAAALEVDEPELRGGQLADAQARGVGGLDEGAVTERQRERRLRSGVTCRPGRREVLVDHREQPLDLVHLEDPWQAPREARRGDRPPRVARSQLGAGRPAMERADRRETLGHRAPGMAVGQLSQVRAQLRARRAAPVHVPLLEPAQIRPDRGRVRALRVR